MAIYPYEMSYQDQSGGGYPPPRQESQYPPPPGEEDERAPPYHQRAPSNTNIILPAMSPYGDPQYSQPQNGYPDPRGYQADPYRAPQQSYRDDRGYQQDHGRGGPQHMAFSQSAPRQRTAIACRYCRRRKVSTFAAYESPYSCGCLL